MFEESDFMAGMFEFVDVGPDLRLPPLFMGCGLAATRTAGVKGYARLCDMLP